MTSPLPPTVPTVRHKGVDAAVFAVTAALSWSADGVAVDQTSQTRESGSKARWESLSTSRAGMSLPSPSPRFPRSGAHTGIVAPGVTRPAQSKHKRADSLEGRSRSHTVKCCRLSHTWLGTEGVLTHMLENVGGKQKRRVQFRCQMQDRDS